ncbi:MAG: tetratricopeptide repeat protein [Burkholderiaceae bacterium]
MSDPIKQALASAIQFHQTGNLSAAESIYNDILLHHPRQPDALNLLATIALQHGEFAYAETLLAQAVDINKKVPQYHVNLAHALKGQHELDRAVKHYALALRLKPDFAEAHQYLGNLLLQQGDANEGVKHLKSAVALSGSAIAHYNLGTAYLKSGDPSAAAEHFKKALQLDAHLTAAHLNLGEALTQLGEHGGAFHHFEKVLENKPDSVEAQIGLGNVCAQANQMTQAISHFQQAIAIQPDHPTAHMNLAHCYLKIANLKDGWREYEWRLKAARSPVADIPQWDGAPLNGKRLLVMAEQGAGDTIQFARYLPLLRERAAGDIVFACHRSLTRLLTPIAGASPVLELEKMDRVLADEHAIDCQVSLMSAPLFLNTEIETIPMRTAYLHADAQLVQQWRQRMSAYNNFKIGIAWAGNPANGNDRYRSFNPEHFARIARLHGITLFSLQKSASKKPNKTVAGVPLIDFTRELDDFADTAALIENLDLVISIDTSIAHLSGALGKPVWTLLHLAADWRYLMDVERCPWYASMRLFRQTSKGDWDSVFDQLVPALQEQLHASA